MDASSRACAASPSPAIGPRARGRRPSRETPLAQDSLRASPAARPPPPRAGPVALAAGGGIRFTLAPLDDPRRRGDEGLHDGADGGPARRAPRLPEARGDRLRRRLQLRGEARPLPSARARGRAHAEAPA